MLVEKEEAHTDGQGEERPVCRLCAGAKPVLPAGCHPEKQAAKLVRQLSREELT